MKLSNDYLFPNAYKTIVGIFTIVKTKNRAENAFKVTSSKDAPRPISFEMYGIYFFLSLSKQSFYKTGKKPIS